MVSFAHIANASPARRVRVLAWLCVWLCVGFVLSASAVAHAQTASTKVSAQHITTQDRLTYTVEAQGRVRGVTPPSGSDFEIAGQSTHTSIHFINGKTTRKQTVSYELLPKRAGTLDTGAATIEFKNGRTLEAERFTIRVDDAGQPTPQRAAPKTPPQPRTPPSLTWPPKMPRTAQTPAAQVFFAYPPLPAPGDAALYTQEDWSPPDDRPFIRAFSNSKDVVVGEPFLIEYLYFEPLTALGFEAQDMDEPEFSNAWFEDITDTRVGYRNRVQRMNYRGQYYNVQIVRSYMVVPLKEGTFVVPPFTLTVAGYTFSRRMEPFDMASSQMNVEVHPLPRKGRPPHSKDNVGRYHIEATLQPEEARIGDTFQLDVRVKGVGVPSQIRVPNVSLPEGLHLRSSDEKQHSEITPFGWLQTQKTAHLSFQASREGDYDIPPISLHWYDPWEETWKTGTTEAITLRVQGTAPNAKAARDSDESSDEENVSPPWMNALLTGENTDENKGFIARMRQRGEPWRGTPLYFVCLAFPGAWFFGSLALGRILHRRRQRREDRLKRTATFTATRALKNCSPGELGSFMRMNDIMRRYLRARGIPGTRGATYDELHQALTRTRNAESADRLTSLLQALEEARYGGSDPVRFHAMRKSLLEWLENDPPEDA